MSVYSLEDRMKAVELYFKYGGSPAAVRRELGYPTKNTVKQWAREFESAGALHERCRRHPPRYSEEQKRAAVGYYLEHGRSMQRTVRALGYPHKATLKEWLDEALPERRGLHSTGLSHPKVELTIEQKQADVVDLVSRDGPSQGSCGKIRCQPHRIVPLEIPSAREGALGEQAKAWETGGRRR
jgi:transposase-like protein